MATAAVAAIAPSLLAPTSAQPPYILHPTSQQRAQAGGAAGTQGTFWYLKSTRCLRKCRESKVNCLAIAVKATMSSATLMHSAVSD